MKNDVLERWVAELEAKEAIRTLKHRYCAYCDDNYNPDGLAGLFVEDGVWDAGPAFGRHEGRPAIRSFFATVSKQILFAAHLVTNDRITVEGDRARGRWWIIMPATIVEPSGGAAAHWLLGEYDDQFVRTEAGWRFERLQASIHFVAPHATGWAKDGTS